MISSLLFAAFLIFSAQSAVSAPTKDILPPYGTCLYDGITMADSDDSTAYFVCCDHLWLLRHCSKGEIFDKYNLTCIPDHVAPTIVPFICTPGDRIENPYDNSKFDECLNGTVWQTKSCPPGALFNPNTKRCQFVPTTAACQFGDTRPSPSGDPAKYLFCFGDGWHEEQCYGGSVYDVNAKTCILPTKRPFYAPTTTESPIYDGSCHESSGSDGFRPNPQNCQTYFQCVHSRWMLRDCGPGTMWRQDILGCDYYSGSC